MKVLVAFVAAVGTAATAFTVEFLAEGLVAGNPFSADDFLLMVALNFVFGIPVAVFGGVPVWILFRSFKVYAPSVFALTGAMLALIAYVSPVGLGMACRQIIP